MRWLFFYTSYKVDDPVIDDNTSKILMHPEKSFI